MVIFNGTEKYPLGWEKSCQTWLTIVPQSSNISLANHISLFPGKFACHLQLDFEREIFFPVKKEGQIQLTMFLSLQAVKYVLLWPMCNVVWGWQLLHHSLSSQKTSNTPTWPWDKQRVPWFKLPWGFIEIPGQETPFTLQPRALWDALGRVWIFLQLFWKLLPSFPSLPNFPLCMITWDLGHPVLVWGAGERKQLFWAFRLCGWPASSVEELRTQCPPIPSKQISLIMGSGFALTEL